MALISLPTTRVYITIRTISDADICQIVVDFAKCCAVGRHMSVPTGAADADPKGPLVKWFLASSRPLNIKANNKENKRCKC